MGGGCGDEQEASPDMRLLGSCCVLMLSCGVPPARRLHCRRTSSLTSGGWTWRSLAARRRCPSPPASVWSARPTR